MLACTGARWEALLRREYGPKSTVRARLKEWIEYGCLERAWAVLLEEYDSEIGIECEWQAGDGCIVKAPLGRRGILERLRRQAEIPQTGAKRARSGIC